MGRMGSGHGPLAVRRGGLILSETIHVLNAIGDAWREAQDGRRLDDVGPVSYTHLTLPTTFGV